MDIRSRSTMVCIASSEPLFSSLTSAEPFARNGSLTLTLEDGIDPNDIAEPKGSAENTSLTIGIKQIQMEQDTAKTAAQPPSTYLLDFNRVSHPLIEIITLPHIHSPLLLRLFARFSLCSDQLTRVLPVWRWVV